MSNWRTTIKKLFADKCVEAIPDIKFFGAWNNQKQQFENEETKPELGIFFEYSVIGDGIEYLLSRDLQRADRVPVEVTLHIMFATFNDQSQDIAYEYADALTCALKGIKDEIILGQIRKTREQEDIAHNAAYDYEISFGMWIKEAVFNDQLQVDANPKTETDPNPATGRRLKIDIDAQLEK